MICLYDNGTFINGITVNASTSFVYNLYCDSNAVFVVSGNTGAYGNTLTLGNATTNLYIGCDSSNNNLANIKLYELTYYQNTSNSFTATQSGLISYLNSRWSLSTYTDTHNVYPISMSAKLLVDATAVGWNQFTYKPSQSQLNANYLNFAVSSDGLTLTANATTRAGEYGYPLC